MNALLNEAGGPLSVGGRSLAREDLYAAGAAVAHRIAGADVVAVHATPTLETVVAVVGCLQSGVPFVPLAPDAGPLERAHVLRDSGALLVLNADLPIDVAERAEPPLAPADGVAAMLYTSGTTGLPKGVVLRRSGLAQNIDLLAQAWGWTPNDVLVHGLPLFHVHGLVLGVLGALRVGSALVHTGRATPQAYAAAAAAGGSLYFGVPTVWSRVAADASASHALRGARLLVSGSAALPESVATALRTHAGQVPVERYGMTETLITLAARHDRPRRVGTVGERLPGVETRMMDDELQVRAPWLFDGYLNLPAASRAAWTDDGWFQTGDTAREQDGFFTIVGRTSVDIIKSGGYKVGAGEVEDALLAHPSVVEAAVVGVADEDLGQRVVAYVVGEKITDLSEFVAQTLSVHKRPREVRWVDALPRNAMGKVQKALLIEP